MDLRRTTPAWAFWFDNPSAKQKQTTWRSSILPIYTISFVEDFWSVYNNIGHPSKMTVGADFHCFKNKIESKWEDPVFANRGKWTACFSKVVNVRTKQENIALSTKNAANEAAQLSIGRERKDFLEYNDAIGFIFHEEAKRLDRGANTRCIV